MSAAALARFQFASTVSFHFFFVPLSIGLGLVMVLFQRRYRKSGSAEDLAAANLWTKIFAATFTIGVATGVAMEFAFGTNWATYSRYVGDIFGAPLAAEGLFSFFLESIFLGVLLFGRGRVSDRFYYVSSWLVWIGSLMSAIWIIIANSWMQTPAGYKIQGGRAILTDFWAAALNPSFVTRYLHVIDAVLLAGGCMAAAVGAYHLLKDQHKEFAKAGISIGLVIAMWATLAMFITGHNSAMQVQQEQPIKMAAMDGHWTDGPMRTYLLGSVNEQAKTTSAVDFYGCFCHPLQLVEHKGLSSYPAKDQPPIWATFQAYHWMLIGYVILLITTIVYWFLNKQGKLEKNRPLLMGLLWLWVVPELAIQAGWFAAEIGRQPWIVQGLLRTDDAISKVVPAYQIMITLGLFGVVYTLLFVGWARVIYKLVKKGPDVVAAKAMVSESKAAAA